MGHHFRQVMAFQHSFFLGYTHRETHIPTWTHRNHRPLNTIETDRFVALPSNPYVSRTFEGLFIYHKGRAVWRSFFLPVVRFFTEHNSCLAC